MTNYYLLATLECISITYIFSIYSNQLVNFAISWKEQALTGWKVVYFANMVQYKLKTYLMES